MTPDLGIEPGPYWWKASALTTAPSLHTHDGNDFVLAREIESIWKISSAWLLSLICEGSDLTMGVMTLSK